MNPTILTIFGATGDLANKKIIPGLYHLHKNKKLPGKFKIIAFARRDFSHGKYLEFIKESIKYHGQVDPTSKEFKDFFNLFFYHQGKFEKKESYESLLDLIKKLETDWEQCTSKIFFFAVPPENYTALVDQISDAKLHQTCNHKEHHAKVVIEKPFGTDYKSAKELNKDLNRLFDENQIYRIDHYLGKKIARKIVQFRQTNPHFEAIWNNKNIEKIEITMLEEIGIEGRGEFYDPLGALKDVGQNHLLELLALIAVDLEKNISQNRVKVLQELKEMTSEEVVQNTVRGQYEGYLKVEGVKNNSETETFFSLKLFLNDEKWKRVPFILKAGKKLKENKKEVIIYFKDKKLIFDFLTGEIREENDSNRILDQDNKNEIQYVGEYEILLREVIEGDHTFFPSIKEILAAWKIIDPISEAWKKNITKLLMYNNEEILNNSF